MFVGYVHMVISLVLMCFCGSLCCVFQVIELSWLAFPWSFCDEKGEKLDKGSK
jgi:hypothetical protein